MACSVRVGACAPACGPKPNPASAISARSPNDLRIAVPFAADADDPRRSGRSEYRAHLGPVALSAPAPGDQRRLALGIDPPGAAHGEEVPGRARRPPELVPISHPPDRLVEMRHHVVAA